MTKCYDTPVQMGNAGRTNSGGMVTIHGLSRNKESNLNMCAFEVKSLGKVYIMWIFEHQNVCVCVCVCVRVFVTNQDIDLYNDTGMTQVLQGEGDFSGH